MATHLDINIVPTYNSATLGIADISTYAATPSGMSMEITPPGFNKVNVEFTPNSVNIYNASHLQIDCDGEASLPDGIYYFKYSISPNLTTYVEKSFMRIDNLLCKYYKTRLSLDECSNDMKESQLQSASILIEGAIASANQCDPNSAYEKYSKAEKILKNITNCNCK